MNSRNSPETRNDDLLADVDGVVAHAFEGACRQVHVHPPLERLRVVGELGDLEVHVAVEPVHRVVHLRAASGRARGRGAAARPSRRAPSRRRCGPSRRSAGRSSRCSGRSRGDLVHLRDVDRLIADALQVQARVHHRPRPAADRPRPAPAAPGAKASPGRARGRSRRSRRRLDHPPRRASSSCSMTASTARWTALPASSPSVEQPELHLLELLVEVRPGHPNLPVT